MLKKLHVYYNGWGEYWLWGTLISSTAITGRPLIAFEYSAEAISKGLELSSYLLALKGDPLRKNFPAHQMGLPGPIYDALPDGWGMLLMDRLFKKNGLNPRIKSIFHSTGLASLKWNPLNDPSRLHI